MENKKTVKICIYDKYTPKNVVLLGNGDAILDNICIKCEVSEGLNRTHDLDAIFICDSEGLYKIIHDEAILKVAMDYGDEIFRISKVNRNKRDIDVFARQITIAETLDMWIEDIRPTQTSGLSALNNLKTASIGKKDIDVFSNITTISTAYFMRMNMYQAIHDCEQSFLNRWGGEVLRRAYNLTINERIGTDRGVEIRSRKNLTGFEANTNIDNVCTRVRAIGFDGIDAGVFIDSPLIDKYSAIKTREIKYEDVKIKDENNPDEGFDTLKEAQAELIRRAKLEFTENHIDELRADYRINFVYLEQTEEYKDYVQAERVYLGDTVSVYEETHDIDINVRVISKKYDVLRQKVIEIELSNNDISQKTLTTSDILAELQSVIKGTNNNNVQDIIQSMINSGIKDSYVIPRQNEIIVADNKDLNLANNVCRLNKNGLGFSRNGYYGTYEYGFTIDGVINASLIATGVLSTVLIQNADGSLQIDLGGKKGIMTRQNGKNAIELAGTILKFYDWDGDGNNVGQIYSTRTDGNENSKGLAISNMKNSHLAFAYETSDGKYHTYMLFDNDRVDPTSKTPITLFLETDFRGSSLWFGHNINSIFNSVENNFVFETKNEFVVMDNASSRSRLVSSKDKLETYDNNGQKYFSARKNGFSFWRDGDDILYTTTSDTIQSDRTMHINGSFSVSGTKNCVQETEHYGERLFYSVEDCESYLTDRSIELFTVEETQENTYERVILLDNVFKESVNLDMDYTVDIIKQSWGDYRIKEQTKDYFIVESDRKDFTFKYVITAKRRGFEEERNKEVFESYKTEDVTKEEYWRLYARDNLKKGSETYAKAL